MATRSVVVKLEAEVAKFVTGMERAGKATDEAKKAQEQLGKAADEAAKKTGQVADKTANDLAALAQSHQDAAKAAGLHYDSLGRLTDGNQRVLNSAQATAHELDAFSEAVYKSGFDAEQAAAAQTRAAAETEKAAAQAAAAQEAAAAATEESAEEVSTALLTFGVASVAGLGASAKAAMDWETAWAGVTKTVDGTPEQMAELESGIRGLAKSLPLAHAEIAAVAEAAGQLGVKREDIVGFTKTMIDLGETTNLTADEAATNIAQISNVMGTMARDGSEGVARFGAALVALGNDGASTEAEILSMAQRIAGAGATVGATEADVLALANTLASMGVNAELGGGVTTRVLLKIYSAVQEGGEGLRAFADVAGLSADEFAKAFGDSPVKAMDLVNKGLARVKSEGGNVVATMKDLGIKGTEETQVMLALAASGDLLSDSLELGSKAWAENTALANEAAKRYETTESKVKIAWNNIKDAAIDAGAVLLPVIQAVAETVSGLAQTFGSLPEPVKGAVTVLAGVVGGASLLGGALLNVIPKVSDLRDNFRTLSTAGSKVPATMLGIGKAAGIATVAYLALTAAAAASAAAIDGSRSKTSIEDFNNALTGMAANGDAARKSLDGAFDGVLNPDMWSGGTTAVNDLDGAMSRLFNASWQDNLTDFGSTLFGQNATSGINATKNAIGNMDKSLASMVQSGNLEDAAAGFRTAAEAAEKQGKPVEALIELFPEYKDAILAAKAANGETQVSQEALTEAMLKADPAAADAAKAQSILDQSLQDTGVSLDAVIEDMDKFLDLLFETGMLTMSSRDAQAAYQEQLDSVAVVVQKITDSAGAMGAAVLANKTDFDLTTEAGRLANDTFQGLARDGMAEVKALSEEGMGQDELQAKLNTTHTDLVQAGIDLGLTKEGAEALARSVLGVPDGVDIKTWMDSQAKKMAEDTKTAVEAIPNKTVTIYGNVDPSFRAAAEEAYRLGQIKSAPGANVNVSSGGVEDMGFADGGAVYGPGTGTSDSITASLSNGEHVLTAAEVQAMGGQQAVYRFRSGLHNGNIPGYANGGAVGTMAASRQLVTFNAPSPAPSAGGGVSIGKVEISEQQNPSATWLEFSRRVSSLAT